jgi:hypothetical protein
MAEKHQFLLSPSLQNHLYSYEFEYYIYVCVPDSSFVVWLLLFDGAVSTANFIVHEVGYCRVIKNDEYGGTLVEAVTV